jgi:glucose dehydrogenase
MKIKHSGWILAAAGVIAAPMLIALPIAAQQAAKAPAKAPPQPAGCCAASTGDMPTTGGNVGNDRYSALASINRQTIKNLGAAWHINVSAAAPASDDVGNETTPVVANGIIYMNTPAGGVIAVDGATGTPKWKWQPEGPKGRGNHRGVTVGEGKVFAENGGHVIAFDAATGRQIWNVEPKGTDGTAIPANATALMYYNGLVYFSGRPGGTAAALHASDGSLAWVFDSVADRVVTDVNGNKIDVAATWGGCKQRGGGGAWINGAIDPELGYFYITTDDSTGCQPGAQDGSKREGLNLFANSIIAVDAKTGAFKWYFQAVHHDIWDMDNVNAPLLADVNIGGKVRKAVYYGGKSAHLFVLDRANGKPLLKADETPVSVDSRQLASPTQPIPNRPFPQCLVWQKLDAKNIPGDPYRGIPNYNGYQPDANGNLVYTEPNYLDPDKPYISYPPGQTHREGCIYDAHWDLPVQSTTSQNGGPTWPTYSFSPRTGLIYYPYGVSMMVHWRAAPSNGMRTIGQYQTGGILGIDAATNTVKWRNHLGLDMGHAQNPLSTAGDLVFVGQVDGNFVGLDATTGKELWRFQVGAATSGGAVTYSINGVQYVAIATGGATLPYGSSIPLGNDLWAFKLGGTYKTESGSSEAPAPKLVTVRRPVGNSSGDAFARGPAEPVEGSTINNTIYLARTSRTEDSAAARDKGDFNAMAPTYLRVPVGTTVTFLNPGAQTFANFPNQKLHCATQFFEGYFNFKLNPGQSAKYTFDHAGQFFFNDCTDPRPTGMVEVYDVPQDLPGAVTFAGNTLDLHSPTGVFTDVKGTVTARFAVPAGYSYEGDAMVKTPLSPRLIPAASAKMQGQTLVIQFNKADIDNNVPMGDGVPLLVSAHFRQAGAQKQLTSTATVKIVK